MIDVCEDNEFKEGHILNSVSMPLSSLVKRMAELDKHKLTDNTLIIYTSDNGGATHFRATDNRPLRSGKGRPYEGGIREPFIVSWPGHTKPASKCDVPILTIDLLPTIAEVTSTAIPNDRPIDGKSLIPLLKQTGSLDRDELFWHFPHYWWGGKLTPYSVIRKGPWKLIRWYETAEEELYNLDKDLSETTDLASQFPDKLAELSKRLDELLVETGAKLPRKNDFLKDD